MGGAHLSIDSGFPLSDFRAHKDALKKLSMTTAMINEPDTWASSRLNAQMPVSTSCPPDMGDCSAYGGTLVSAKVADRQTARCVPT